MRDLVKYRTRRAKPRKSRIYIRVSDEEKTAIRRRAIAAGYQSVGAYLVALALDTA